VQLGGHLRTDASLFESVDEDPGLDLVALGIRAIGRLIQRVG
jgi:hypothetical protein